MGGGGLVEGFWEGQGGGGSPWCVALVCSWRRLLADRHSLPFPWTFSPHRPWCPSTSQHLVSFLFFLALSPPLYFPFLSLGLSLHRPWCPSACHHPVSFLFLLAQSFPLHFTFLSLGRLANEPPHFPCFTSLCQGVWEGLWGVGGRREGPLGGEGSWLLLHIIILHFGPNSNSDPSPNGYLDPTLGGKYRCGGRSMYRTWWSTVPGGSGH